MIGGVARPTVGGAILVQVVLGSIRMQAEQATGSKPVGNTAPWPLHQLLPPGSLLWHPSVMDYHAEV